MKYETLKGLEISALSLGTVQLGMDYGINNAGGKPTEEKAFELLQTAVDGGISVIDTSSDYGTSEEVVGKFFKQYKGKKPTIVTKFKIENDHTKVAPISDVRKNLRTQVETSLERLGYDSLPILMLHRESELFDYGDVLPRELEALKAEKMVDRVGVSLNGCTYVKDVLANDLYEAVQIPLNMMDTQNVLHGGIDKLKEKGVIVFIRSVFLQGLFFRDPETLPETGLLSQAKEPLRRLHALAREEGLSVAQVAITFMRDLAGVNSLVLGAENPDQVRQNLELANAPALSASAREKILDMFGDINPDILKPWLWNK